MKRWYRIIGASVLGIVFATAISLCIIVLMVPPLNPFQEPPGEGKTAEAGYTLSKKVINALDRYKADRGSYPEELSSLYPKYIQTRLQEAGHGDTEGISFYYGTTVPGSYRLEFVYFGPGVNNCVYEFASTPAKWDCNGHY